MADTVSSKSRKGIVFVVIAIAIAAILIVVLYSAFSIGSIGTTTTNPFGPGEGPPKIVMSYQGREYEGQLQGYVWGERRSFTDLPKINRQNVTSVSEGNLVNIQEGSQVRFTIVGNPPSESDHDSLSVTAFSEIGDAVTVLDADGDPTNNTYSTSNLEEGNQYILISAATWYPDERSEIVTGYVVYGHRINITSPADS